MLKSSSAWMALMSLTAVAVELVLDHVKQTAVQPLDQLKRFHVKGTDRLTAIVGYGSGLRRRTRIDHCLCLSFVAR